MLRLAGPRFLLYGVFIGAVAAAAALSHLGTGGIVAAMAATWLLLSALEWAVSRAVALPDGEVEEEEEEDPGRVRPATSFTAVPPVVPEVPAVVEPTSVPETEAEPGAGPTPEPEPAAVQESGVPPEVPPPAAIPEPERMPVPPLARERLRPRLERPAPPPEPERPAVPERPVPERRAEPRPAPPPPEQRPVPAQHPVQPRPEPVAGATPLMPVGGRGGREWNIWDLERAAREAAGADAFKDEERAYLLMYLREFANADGILPADFDGLIRDSFGDLSSVR